MCNSLPSLASTIHRNETTRPSISQQQHRPPTSIIPAPHSSAFTQSHTSTTSVPPFSFHWTSLFSRFQPNLPSSQVRRTPASFRHFPPSTHSVALPSFPTAPIRKTVVSRILSITELAIVSHSRCSMPVYVLGGSRDKTFRLPPFDALKTDL